jgi:hypothetical protein
MMSSAEKAAAGVWHQRVVRGRCVMCAWLPAVAEDRARRAVGARKQAHHLLPKRYLKREGLHAHLWDVRNGMALCAFHHERHENFVQRVPRQLLLPTAFEFADELGLGWLIDREYPA